MRAATEAVMFPYFETTTTVTHESFELLRRSVQESPEGLHLVASWYFHGPADGVGSDRDSFALQIIVPSSNQTISHRTEYFDRVEVDAWLANYIRHRTLRWYGWTESAEAVDINSSH